jgi:hypothetical protein
MIFFAAIILLMTTALDKGYRKKEAPFEITAQMRTI